MVTQMCLPAYVFMFGQWTDEGFYPPQMLVQYIPPESQLHVAECRWCRSDADWLASGLEKGSEQQQSSQEMGDAWKKSINVQYENYRLFHFSSVDVRSSLSCAAGWWTSRSTSKSNPQTGWTTYFMHWLNQQQTLSWLADLCEWQ